MENCSSYFCNTACEYYPCHKEMMEREGMKDFNCLFCFCPLYRLEHCPGTPEMITTKDGRKIKDCSNCIYPHQPKNYETICRLLS